MTYINELSLEQIELQFGNESKQYHRRLRLDFRTALIMARSEAKEQNKTLYVWLDDDGYVVTTPDNWTEKVNIGSYRILPNGKIENVNGHFPLIPLSLLGLRECENSNEDI